MTDSLIVMNARILATGNNLKLTQGNERNIILETPFFYRVNRILNALQGRAGTRANKRTAVAHSATLLYDCACANVRRVRKPRAGVKPFFHRFFNYCEEKEKV